MFGELLSTAIRVVTLPVDAVNAGLDIVAGGDGSKESRRDNPLLGDIEAVRDEIADTAEEI